MKKIIQGKDLESLLESIHKKSDGLLAIDCEFFDYLIHYDFQYLLKDICAGECSSNELIKETLDAIQMVIMLAEIDALNIRKCVAFINKKYPHAIFSGENFLISVHNLTSEEIEDCRSQKDLKITYYTTTNT